MNETEKSRLDIPLHGYFDYGSRLHKQGSWPKADNLEKHKYTKTMKSIITSIIAVAALLFTAVAADEAKPAAPAAEGKKKADPEAMFKKLDSNSDGSISLDEFKAGPIGKKDAAKAEEIFKKKDKDSDGKLTKEEATATHAKKKDK